MKLILLVFFLVLGSCSLSADDVKSEATEENQEVGST